MLPTINKINSSATGKIDPEDVPDLNRSKFLFKKVRPKGEDELDDTDLQT